jgi:small subunit ribosomal protein S4e
MASSHLKRIVAPKTWPILRKTTKMISRPKPNGQKMEMTLPVVLVMREMLGLVQTAQQAKKILRTTDVTVNGRRIYDTDSTVGFMDLLHVGGKNYRVLINQNNVLTVTPAKEDVIVQKITNKTTIGKGKTQINCASGRNLLVAKDEYKVGDSIVLDKDGKLTGHYSLEHGASVLLTGGSHIGKVGTVESISGHTIIISVGDEKLQTATTHAYVIGKGKPAITIEGK